MDDEDPMAYLNKMKAQMAQLEVMQSVGDEAIQAAISAKESMERIDAMLEESPEKDRSSNRPPPGLSPEEEVEWWNNRIAFLSRDVSAGDSSDSKSAKPERVSSSKLDNSDAKEYKSDSKGDKSYKK
jgi:hypothetical protein